MKISMTFVAISRPLKYALIVAAFAWGLVPTAPVFGEDIWDEKVQEARRQLKRDSKNPLLYEKLGWAYLERYMRTGNKSDGVRAINVFKRFVKIDDKEASAWYGLGVAYYKTGQTGKSGEYFNKAIELDGELFQGQVAMGNYYLNKGMFRKAASHYQKAGAIQPKNQFVYTNLAQLYLAMGNYKKSIYFADKALDIDPNNVHSNLVKARVFRFRGQNQKTGQILKRVLKENSRNSEVIIEIAQNYYDTGDYKRAKSFALRHNTINETSGNGFELLANIYKRTGRISKMKGNISVAEDLYHKKLVAGAVEFYGALSWLNSEYSLDKARALEYAWKYIKLKETAGSLKILAWALYKNEEFKEALQACKRAVKLNPWLAEHWYRLGMIQKKLNNTVQAKKAFRKALTMGPKTYHEETKAELFALK